MKTKCRPVYEFLLAEYCRSLKFEMKSCQFDADIRLIGKNKIEVKVPIGVDFYALISITGIIRMNFYHLEWSTPRMQFIKPIKISRNQLPQDLADMFLVYENDLCIFPENPTLDILKTSILIERENQTLQSLLEEEYFNQYKNQNDYPEKYPNQIL